MFSSQFSFIYLFILHYSQNKEQLFLQTMPVNLFP